MRKFLFALSVVVALAGCPGSGPKPDEGALVLSIQSDGIATRTILPSISMAIASFDVTGDGPGTESFERLGLPANTTTVVEESLSVGSWTVAVDAKNGSGTAIGHGTTSVEVQSGQIVEAGVTVTPLGGTGTLQVIVSWPSDLVTSPSVSGTLTPAGGSPTTLTFALAGNELSATYAAVPWAAGYYTLAVRLLDGTSDVWGAVEAVRIVEGQPTVGQFGLTSTDLNLAGSLNVTVTPTMRSPITITLSGNVASLVLGTDMTVTATPSETVDLCRWYRNGTLIEGENEPSLTVGSLLPEGNYRLDVVAVEGTVLGSQHHDFDVTAAPAVPGVGAWTTGTSFTTARNEHASAANNGYLYVIGGHGPLYSQDNSLADVQYAAINDDGTMGAWQTTTSIPFAQGRLTAYFYGGRVYVLGGWYAASFTGSVHYATVNGDGTVGSWTATTYLPTAKRYYGPAFYNGRIYAMGGQIGDTSYTDQVHFATIGGDGTLGAWTATTSLPQARTVYESACWDGFIYVTGGWWYSGGHQFTADVLYAPINTDGTLGLWTATTSLPQARAGHDTVAYDGYLYVFGGGNATGKLTSVAYASVNADGTVGTWVTTTAMPSARAGMKAAVAGRRIFLTGGEDGTLFYNDVRSAQFLH